jgi:hypothetical protein
MRKRLAGAHDEAGFAGWDPICTSPDIEPSQALSHMPGLVWILAPTDVDILLVTPKNTGR